MGLDLFTLERLEVLLLLEQNPALKLFLLEEVRLLLIEVLLESDVGETNFDWSIKILNDCDWPIGKSGNPRSSSVTSPGIQNSLCQDKGNLNRSVNVERRICLGNPNSLSLLRQLSKLANWTRKPSLGRQSRLILI